MSFLTPGQLTFTPNQVREFADIIVKELIAAPEHEQFLTIVENIVAGDKIGYATQLDKITKKYSGCDPTFPTHNIDLTEKAWNPAKVEILHKECLDALELMFAVYLKNKGVDAENWEGTDMLDFFMEMVLNNGPKRDFHRIVWFNDTDHAQSDDTPTGTISPSVSLTDYNIIDGFWSQLYAIIAANPARKVTITKNAGGTYAAQEFDATDTTNKTVTGIFRQMLQKADPRLKADPSKFILCTRSMADQYENELESVTVQGSFEMIMPGISILKRKGTPIFAIDIWDDIIRSDFDNGTTYYKPHRALLTTKANLMVGVDAKSSLNKWLMHYQPQERQNYIMGGYKVSALIAKDYMVEVAI